MTGLRGVVVDVGVGVVEAGGATPEPPFPEPPPGAVLSRAPEADIVGALSSELVLVLLRRHARCGVRVVVGDDQRDTTPPTTGGTITPSTMPSVESHSSSGVIGVVTTGLEVDSQRPWSRRRDQAPAGPSSSGT